MKARDAITTDAATGARVDPLIDHLTDRLGDVRDANPFYAAALVLLTLEHPLVPGLPNNREVRRRIAARARELELEAGGAA